jgi:hypothetical protein
LAALTRCATIARHFAFERCHQFKKVMSSCEATSAIRKAKLPSPCRCMQVLAGRGSKCARPDHPGQSGLLVDVDRQPSNRGRSKARSVKSSRVSSRRASEYEHSANPGSGRRPSHALEVRQFNPTRVADDDVFDVAFAIDESADLPIRFMRQFTQLPGKLGRYDLRG